MTEQAIIKQLEKCSKFEECSANICPLDLEANQRTYLAGEPVCPYCERRKREKGHLRPSMPVGLMKIMPKDNVKFLNRKNQNRYRRLVEACLLSGTA